MPVTRAIQDKISCPFVLTSPHTLSAISGQDGQLAVSIAHTTNQTGNFEPPGSAALKSYVAAYDDRTDPIKLALRRAEERARQAEKRVSTEDVVPARPPPKPKGPKCSVCFKHCQISVNPWQRTK
ncbi:hypothetical protein B0H14DRAFT_2591620, partial [Mycena olivaceomarginata]